MRASATKLGSFSSFFIVFAGLTRGGGDWDLSGAEGAGGDGDLSGAEGAGGDGDLSGAEVDSMR